MVYYISNTNTECFVFCTQTLLDVQRLGKEIGKGIPVNRRGNQEEYEAKLVERLLKAYRHSLCRLYHHFSPYLK